MKKILLCLVLVAALSGNAFAAKPGTITHLDSLWVGDRTDTADVTPGVDDMFISGTLEVDGAARFDGAVTLPTGDVSAGEIADTTRCVNLPLASFITNGVPVTNATAPGIEVDDLVPGIVWADGETTPADITFPIPDDYSSGGTFYGLFKESDSTTPNEVDFSVYLNSDGTASDSAATDQTPVALAGTTSTPDEITMSVTTDFAALTSSDWITFGLWRDDVADGTGDLEMIGAKFCYESIQ
jgi:hypothetical protein